MEVEWIPGKIGWNLSEADHGARKRRYGFWTSSSKMHGRAQGIVREGVRIRTGMEIRECLHRVQGKASLAKDGNEPPGERRQLALPSGQQMKPEDLDRGNCGMAAGFLHNL